MSPMYPTNPNDLKPVSIGVKGMAPPVAGKPGIQMPQASPADRPTEHEGSGNTLAGPQMHTPQAQKGTDIHSRLASSGTDFHDPIHEAVGPMIMSGLGHIGNAMGAAFDFSGRTGQAQAAPSTGASSGEGAHLPEASGMGQPRVVANPQAAASAEADAMNARWDTQNQAANPHTPDAKDAAMEAGGNGAAGFKAPAANKIAVQGQSSQGGAAIGVPSYADVEAKQRGWVANTIARQMQTIRDHQREWPGANLDNNTQAMATLADAYHRHMGDDPAAQSRMLAAIRNNPDALAAYSVSQSQGNPAAVAPMVSAANGAAIGNQSGPGQVTDQNLSQWQAMNPDAAAAQNDPGLSPAEQYARMSLLPGANDPNSANHQAMKIGIQRQIAADGAANYAANSSYAVPNPDAIQHPMGDFGRGVTGFVNSLNPWGAKGTSTNVDQWRKTAEQQEKFRQGMRSMGIDPDTGRAVAPQ